MNGFKVVGSTTGLVEYVTQVSHGAIAKGDPVTLKTDGQVEHTPAGHPIYGVAINAATGAGQAVTVAKAVGLLVLADSDEVGDNMAADLIGARVDITGASGAKKVDVSTALQVGDGTDSGQLLVVKNNPQGYGFDADTSICICEVKEVQ
jgi:hypothetical protein